MGVAYAFDHVYEEFAVWDLPELETIEFFGWEDP